MSSFKTAIDNATAALLDRWAGRPLPTHLDAATARDFATAVLAAVDLDDVASVGDSRNWLSPDEVLERAATMFGLSDPAAILTTNTRTSRRARWSVMLVLRARGASMTDIGQWIGRPSSAVKKAMRTAHRHFADDEILAERAATLAGICGVDPAALGEI